MDFSQIQNFFQPRYLKIKFLVIGSAKRKPIKSVANPGIIKSNAATAKAAPDIISKIGI